MIIQFTLTMPNRGSWNGKWSGEKNLYATVVNIGQSKKRIAKYSALVGYSFFYNFGDGWSASVSVREIDNKEARVIRRESKGFCGYDWMIASIVDRGEIKGSCIHHVYDDQECKRCATEHQQETER